MNSPSSSGQESLRSWHSPLRGIGHLANLHLQTHGVGAIEVAIEDLMQKEMHVFVFTKVLGYRFEDAFNVQRVGNSFIVEESRWIGEMKHQPYCYVDLNDAKHFKFNCGDGEFDVIALQMPKYAKCPSASYKPYGIKNELLSDLPSP